MLEGLGLANDSNLGGTAFGRSRRIGSLSSMAACMAMRPARAMHSGLMICCCMALVTASMRRPASSLKRAFSIRLVTVPGLPAPTSTDVTQMLEGLKGQIGKDQFDQEVTTSLMACKHQIDALDALGAYDPEQPYEKGQMVVVDGRIYQASEPAPTDPSGPNGPPNSVG